MKQERIELLSHAPVRQAILRLSLPVVAGMMIQVLYNLVDMFFIGLLKDANPLAAVNISTPVFMILMALATIVSTGSASYLSRCLGAKDYATSNNTLTTSLLITLIISLFAMAAGLFFTPAVVRSLGAGEEYAALARGYTRVLLLGSPFILGNYTLGQLLRAEGDAMSSVKGMLLGTAVNIVLDPLFIFALHLGVSGAALATVLGNALGLIYYVVVYARASTLVHFSIRGFSLKGTVIAEIFRIGIPAALSQLLVSVAMILTNRFVIPYGTTVVAGMGIALKIMTMGSFIFMGFAAGCQPLVGFNYGAKNLLRVKRILKEAVKMTVFLGAVLFLLFWILGGPLINLFAHNMTAILDSGTSILWILSISLFVLGPLMLASTFVQALGRAKALLFLSVARQGLFFIPLLLVLSQAFGLTGVLFAQPLSDVATTAVALSLLRSLLKQEEEKANAQGPSPSSPLPS
ncbi:Multi antimicrobial extrusion protein (Na(+)/drug antiporter) [Clostridiaceae bacterium JG1575]|nr:Multi antimicrobial extrusion protein (Na(+)/drug antiporter) [Clostridiaceae bacterium JG1575]